MKKFLVAILLLCLGVGIFFAIKNADWNSLFDSSIPPTEQTSSPEIEQTNPHQQENHTHIFSEWKTVKEADCVESGTQERICNCGTQEIQTIGAIGHTEVTDAAVTATCTTDGLTEGKHCSRCNEILIAQEIINAHHSFGEWEIVTAANCFTEGEEQRTCEHCEKTEIQIVKKVSHNFLHDEALELTYCELCSSYKFNGNVYLIINEGLTWEEARQYCENLGGHLVTITSQEEQSFIENIIPVNPKNNYWLGGTKTDSGFVWITGESFSYTNWADRQPDYSFEDKMHIYAANNPIANGYVGEWNNLINEGTFKDEILFGLKNFGFICEWEVEE